MVSNMSMLEIMAILIFVSFVSCFQISRIKIKRMMKEIENIDDNK